MKYPEDIKILSIDPAIKTGWAFLANSILTSGSLSFERRYATKTKPGEHKGKTFLGFHRWLRNFILESGPDWIVFEDVAFAGKGDNRIYGGMRGIILMNAYAKGIEVGYIVPCKIKKFGAGHGHATKDMMIDAARRKYPDQNVLNDDQADALHILHFYLNQPDRA